MIASLSTLSLKTLLRIDAATCLAMGLALVSASGPISALIGVPAGLLFWAGAALLPIAAFMLMTAASIRPPVLAVALVLVGNLGWALASIALPLAGVISPNPLGYGFLVLQAIAVLVLTELEFAAARRKGTAAA